MKYLIYVAVWIAVWGVTYGAYLGLSKGLSASARHQQASRFAIAALLAVASAALAGISHVPAGLWAIWGISAAWMVTWPVIDLVSRRSHATEIDNKMDFAFGLHLAGLMSAAWIACEAWWPGAPWIGVLFAVIELPLLMMLLGQWVYFAVYRSGVDHDGLRLAMNTYPSEVWEFVKSFPWWGVLPVALGCVCAVAAWFALNICSVGLSGSAPWQPWAEAALCAVIAFVTFHGKQSPWRRTGVVTLWRDNREYIRQNRQYAGKADERAAAFRGIRPLPRRGRTFVLVIGESASRDYMSAFTPQPGGIDDTPWLSALASGTGQTVLFPKAYSCHFQTVPTLTHALTARNQHNDMSFADAPSVVDAAHALGLKVYWYSNQSHIGANDTPVSLMAESADRCAWTKLALNRIPYDDTLLDFLPELSAADDNLLVLHLKGSHFNYESRYPAESAIIKPHSGKDGYEDHYRNSLAYTDRVLSEVYRYCVGNLNLAAMIYCSDHADIPTSRRSPVFNGIARLRIPLFVSLSDGYAAENPALAASLRDISRDIFVNDFLYDLTLAVLSPDQFGIPRPEGPLKSMGGTVDLSADNNDSSH